MKNTIEILERMNEWRRSDLPVFDGGEMPCPKEFGLAIDDAISKLRAMEWQPIETAPRDGSIILLHEMGRVAAGYLRESSNDIWVEPDFGNDLHINPTHWIPLPSPPAC